VTGIAQPLRYGDIGGSTPMYAIPRAGVSLSGTVGITSAVIVPAGTLSAGATIMNTHASQTMTLSFNANALATDFKLGAGASITLPFGPTNALYALGSGAGTTYAVIGG
jgi:hypothetical protein